MAANATPASPFKRRVPSKHDFWPSWESAAKLMMKAFGLSNRANCQCNWPCNPQHFRLVDCQCSCGKSAGFCLQLLNSCPDARRYCRLPFWLQNGPNTFMRTAAAAAIRGSAQVRCLRPNGPRDMGHMGGETDLLGLGGSDGPQEAPLLGLGRMQLRPTPRARPILLTQQLGLRSL